MLIILGMCYFFVLLYTVQTLFFVRWAATNLINKSKFHQINFTDWVNLLEDRSTAIASF